MIVADDFVGRETVKSPGWRLSLENQRELHRSDADGLAEGDGGDTGRNKKW